MENKLYAMLLLAASCYTVPTMAQWTSEKENTKGATATFESIDLGERGYANGDDQKGGFADEGFTFANTYNPTYGSWTGFAISDKKETDFIDYTTSQYNSCVGHGVDNSSQYAVYYYSSYGRTSVTEGEAVKSADGRPFEARGFYVTNSAWNVSAYTIGDGMTEGAFHDGDWCKLTVYGVKDNEVRGSVDFYLADYRSDNETGHYYVKDWTWLDLSKLGTVDQLNFEVTASRANEWGTTTPTYFCMDNFNDPNGSLTGISNTGKPCTTYEVARYLTNGTRISAPQPGINIVRMSDGTTHKEWIK